MHMPLDMPIYMGRGLRGVGRGETEGRQGGRAEGAEEVGWDEVRRE